jgi:hypothetical protein
MTPEQKVQWLILIKEAEYCEEEAPNVTEDNVEDLYDAIVANDDHWDAMDEVRCSGTLTGIPCFDSRNFESDAVAAQLPDGTWVGWVYWYGGGKHGNPDEIEWMDKAYHVFCDEVEEMMVVRSFRATKE